MGNNQHHVLIDTDVILDFFFDREPFSEYATQVFSLCESGEVIGYTTPVIYSNAYYILRQVADHTSVLRKLNQLFSITNVLIISGEEVQKALISDFKDFEDALQYYSALNNEMIETILTRNLKDYKNSTLSVLTPESFIKSFF